MPPFKAIKDGARWLIIDTASDAVVFDDERAGTALTKTVAEGLAKALNELADRARKKDN